MLDEILADIQKPPKIVSVVGSGLSKGSGMPTFRGKDGLWKNYNAQDLATPHAFRRDSKLVWNWYRWRMRKLLTAKPNPGHYALVELEKKGMSIGIITQNVDGIHTIAGNSPEYLVEIHGRIRYVWCMECDYKTRWDTKEMATESDIVPQCPQCGSKIYRPDVVWFGESLPKDAITKVYEWINQANLMLVIGTSGTVYPVSSFPGSAKQLGLKVIEFNIEPTPLTPICDHSIFGPCEETLPRFVEMIMKLSQ